VDPNAKTRPVGYHARTQQRIDSTTQPGSDQPELLVKQKNEVRPRKRFLPWKKPKEAIAPAIAYLIPLIVADEVTIPATLGITADDVSLGSDPLKVNLIIILSIGIQVQLFY
jgi:hypothetical protein